MGAVVASEQGELPMSRPGLNETLTMIFPCGIGHMSRTCNGYKRREMGEQLIILYAYMYIVQSEQQPKNNDCANDMTPFSNTNTLMQCGKDASQQCCS
jgi:hypothetical protein